MYPGDKFIAPSHQYKVEVLQNGRMQESFVYLMHAQHYTNKSETASFTGFDFTGRVTVRVTRLTEDIGFCQVLPRSRGIAVRLAGRTVEFELDRPGQFSVEFERGLRIRHPLFIFANPPDVDVPRPDDPRVTWFGPGVHEIGEKFVIPSGQTVYLAGGAYVKGQFFSENAQKITIRGRGILSGEQFPVRTAHYMITFRNVEQALVEGITLIHPPTHNIRLTGRDHVVRNVKLFGWHFSTDGASTGSDGMIEDSFMHVNDDSIMLYENNTSARRCVIWQMENGAPFQFGWGGEEDRSGHHASDIDVIRVESEWDNENEAVFCAIHGGGGTKSDYLFENIRIDNADWRMFSIITKPNRWGQWNPEAGAIRRVVFRNIEFYGTPRIASLIMGHDEKHPVTDVTFDNVIVGGKKLAGADPDVIAVDPETTRNIVFK
ncbi:hypothetical protein [Oleiharenicola lentus]|uniref:hypothetical protein n=1 Tax=Oleiharenicola lentus TaxID=2508720 RepID=UPI0013E94E5E|nr:hypothetical protein [Oleiharenicola lentus]